ncbi:hypothetical protein DPMN_188455 [Dreissena polymorpha]|uniref:Uncharacterized protein n=1 Tax=Dreissena polymorpha TaxID=45954 RepID=A0A9D4I9Y3_DREPO|nr:hypothetical protein DPMN_188455 [Dreissena polymorpha]
MSFPRAGRLQHCWDCCLLQDAADLSPAVYRRELADPDLPEKDNQCGGNTGRTRTGFFLGEGPRDSGTQYAQRTGETVSGMKTTAVDSERGHKGRAACLHSFGGAVYRQEFVFELSTTSAH